jgi:hypothetical protein
MFDLQNDPWEQKNLYGSAELARVRATLLQELSSLKMKAANQRRFVNIPD